MSLQVVWADSIDRHKLFSTIQTGCHWRPQLRELCQPSIGAVLALGPGHRPEVLALHSSELWHCLNQFPWLWMNQFPWLQLSQFLWLWLNLFPWLRLNPSCYLQVVPLEMLFLLRVQKSLWEHHHQYFLPIADCLHCPPSIQCTVRRKRVHFLSTYGNLGEEESSMNSDLLKV